MDKYLFTALHAHNLIYKEVPLLVFPDRTLLLVSVTLKHNPAKFYKVSYSFVRNLSMS